MKYLGTVGLPGRPARDDAMGLASLPPGPVRIPTVGSRVMLNSGGPVMDVDAVRGSYLTCSWGVGEDRTTAEWPAACVSVVSGATE